MLDTNQNHLDQGLAFPLNVTMRGNMQTSPKNQNIEESIRIILRTHLGETVYRPDFAR